MSACIKIRGIYSTALTKLMLDAGYHLVDPSSKIRRLFALENADGECEILIQDRPGLQGVELTGPPEKMTQCLTFLQERLLDAALLSVVPVEEETGMVKAAIEFPGFAKQVLDETRLTVVPTISRHHRYRTIASKTLEQAEQTLLKHPEKKESLDDAVFQMEILLPLEKEGLVRLEHIRPAGKPMRPREGVLVSSDPHGLVFRRIFSQGRYDGLNVPIQEGDYGLTEIQEGLVGQAFLLHPQPSAHRPLLQHQHSRRALPLRRPLPGSRSGYHPACRRKTNPYRSRKTGAALPQRLHFARIGDQGPGRRGRPSTKPELERVHEILTPK